MRMSDCIQVTDNHERAHRGHLVQTRIVFWLSGSLQRSRDLTVDRSIMKRHLPLRLPCSPDCGPSMTHRSQLTVNETYSNIMSCIAVSLEQTTWMSRPSGHGPDELAWSVVFGA